MLLINMEFAPDKKIVRHLGLVQGSIVRAKHIGRDIMAGLKNVVGGELKGYTELMNEARDAAVERMCEQAESLGANAILNIRFSTSTVTSSASEILVYGSAVILEDR
jgi:uncharacterized protein YbjQ (UPF0145 family)